MVAYQIVLLSCTYSRCRPESCLKDPRFIIPSELKDKSLVDDKRHEININQLMMHSKLFFNRKNTLKKQKTKF